MVKKSLLQQLVGNPSTDDDVMRRLGGYPNALEIFSALPTNRQRDFLDFCAGKTSLYLCYDSFFHYVFNPEVHGERVERLLSALLEQDIRIVNVLNREQTRFSEMGAEVVVDLLVRIGDGSLVDLEIQKCGYKFPIERMDCYCSNLVAHEYDRLHVEYGDQFSYTMLHPTIAIVLMETSPGIFKTMPGTYIHRGQIRWDSGIALNGLFRQVYVCLDIFDGIMQNKDISNELEAWLTVLTTRDLARIERLLSGYPEFSGIYRDVFAFRRKPEELIGMYTYPYPEALLVADRNLDRMMIDEFREGMEHYKKESAEKDQIIAALREENRLLKEGQ